MKIAIIGANGFVGKNIVNVLKKKHKIIKISKKTKFEKLRSKFDIIIHSANSSKKYEATKYPSRDFKNSVKLTKKIIDYFGDNKIILISTISVNDKKNIYSINRKLCENLVLKKNKNNIIFRLSVLFNYKLKRGILYDLIKNNKVFLNKNTLINPITIEEVAKYILDNLKSKKRIHEIGSIEKFTLNFLSKTLGSKSKFGNTNLNLVSRKSKLNKFTSKKLIGQLKKHIN